MKYQRKPEKVNVDIFEYGWNLEDGHGCTKHGSICGQMNLSIAEGAKLCDPDCSNCVQTKVFCSLPFVWLEWNKKRVPLNRGDIIVTKEDGTKEVYKSKEEFDKLYEQAD